MKTRRIHLQPGECVEVFNAFGTSCVKVTTPFDKGKPISLLYEQPGVALIASAAFDEFELADLTALPGTEDAPGA